MASNQFRGTPGLLLLTFALILAMLAVSGWLRQMRSSASEATPATASQPR